MRKITASFQRLVLGRADISVGHVAEWLDKAPSTIYGMLNPSPPEGRTDKLGVEDAFTICDHLKDYSPIIQALTERGYHISKSETHRPPLSGGSAHKELSEVCAAVGHLADKINRAIQDEKELSGAELLEVFNAATCVYDELQDILSGALNAMKENDPAAYREEASK